MRQRPEETPENHERWLVSYADFITLLFAFFVVMYSISSVNDGKYRILSQTLVSAFTGQPEAAQPIQIGPPLLDSSRLIDLPPMPKPTPITPQAARAAASAMHSEARQQELAAVAQALTERLRPQIDRGEVQVSVTPLGVSIDIRDTLLFPSGQASLEPQAMNLLKDIAEMLTTWPYQVQVNGYTDNVPIRNGMFASNWELSAMRAVSVVQTLIRYRVPPERLVAAGYGEYHPVASNDTPEGRAANRRVSIVLLSPDHPAGTPALARGGADLKRNVQGSPSSAGQPPSKV